MPFNYLGINNTNIKINDVQDQAWKATRSGGFMNDKG